MIGGTMKRLRLGVLGSGRGSNCAAILGAIRAGELCADVVIVGSDGAGAGILRLAEDAGIESFVINEPRYRTRLSPEVEADLVERLRAAEVDLVVLAGYLRVVKAPLLEAFHRRIVNIHPSLLPEYRGLRAWRQAVEAGATRSGCTVHYVDAGVDTGEILGRTEVPVLPDDTAESLHARIQVAEHALYPAVLERLAEECVQMKDRPLGSL
jgi:phosphoribosylglycinamide formyltransferase-1